MTMLESLDQFEQFLDATENGGKPLVVAFTATWCPPCKKISPVYESLVEEYPGLVLTKVDFDINNATVKVNKIKSLPTFKVFMDGEEIMEVRGGKPAALVNMLESADFRANM